MENNEVKPGRKKKKIVILVIALFLVCAAGVGGVFAWNALSGKETDQPKEDDGKKPGNHTSNGNGNVLDENGMPSDGSDITVTETAGDIRTLRELLLEDSEIAIELTEDIRITESFLVNGTKKLVGNKTITMELYSAPAQAIFTVQPGSTLILDGATLDGNGIASGVRVSENAGFTSISGKIVYPTPYGVVSAGTSRIKNITIDTTVEIGVCAEATGKVYVEGGRILNCFKSGIYIVNGGYARISGDTLVDNCYICVNNFGTCDISNGVLTNAWRYLVANNSTLNIDYQGKNAEDRLEWHHAGEFGIRAGGTSKTYINGLYIHDVDKVAIRGINHEGLVVENCLLENTGTFGFESANGKQDAVLTNIVVRNTKDSGVRVYGGNRIEITNLTVTDAAEYGIKNGDCILEAKNVTINSVGNSGIYGGLNSVTVVDGATITRAMKNGIRNNSGTITARNVIITEPQLSGVYTNGGSVTTLSNITINSPKYRGVENMGGEVTADQIAVVSPGTYGVTSTKSKEYTGKLSVTNLTVTGVIGYHAVNCNNSVLEVNGGTFTDIKQHGVNVVGGGQVALANVDIKNCGMRGIYVVGDGSTATATDVNISDTGMSGVFVGTETAVADLKNITITNAGMTSGTDTDYSTSYRSGLGTTDGKIHATNVTVTEPVGSGVYVNGGTIEAEGVKVVNPGENGLFTTSSATYGEGVAKVDGLTVENPKLRGVYNNGGSITLTTKTEIINPEGYGVTTAKYGDYAGKVSVSNLTVTGVQKNNALNCNASVMEIHGGTLSDIASYGANIVGGGQLTLIDVAIRDCGKRGICVVDDGSAITVKNSSISDTGMSGIFVGTGAASADLENVTITNAGLTSDINSGYTASYRSGLGTTDADIRAKNVTINSSVGSGVYVNGGTIQAEGIKVVNPGENGVYVTRSTTYGEAVARIDDLTVVSPAKRGVYNDGGDVTLTTKVEITDPAEHGMTTANYKDYMGSLTAENLTMTGVKKNNALNCNGSVLTVNGGTLSDIAIYGANIVEGGQLTMTDVTIRDCGRRGICVVDDGSVATVKNTSISDTGMSGIFVGTGEAFADLENVTITNVGSAAGTDTEYSASYRSGLGTTDATIHAKNVTISSAVGSGVYINGGTIEAEGIKVVNPGENGVYVTRSATYGEAVAKIDDLTVVSPAKRGVYNDGGDVTLTTKVEITDPAEHGMTTAKYKDYMGSLTAENLTVTGAAKNALNCNGSVLEVKGGTISGAGEYGANVVGGGQLALTDVAVVREEENIFSSMNVDGGSTLSLMNSSITGSGREAASAITVTEGTLNIDGGTYQDNVTNKNGAVVLISEKGVANIKDAVFRNNKAIGGNTFGGAVTSNSKEQDALTIQNTTFIGNSAVYGGAISVGGGCSMTLKDCEFRENSATYGADIRTAASHVYLSGKIVAEFYSTSSTGVLEVVENLSADSDVRVKFGRIANVKDGAVIAAFADGTMSGSKDYVQLAEEHRDDCRLEYTTTEQDAGTIVLKKGKFESDVAAVVGTDTYTSLQAAIDAAAAASTADNPVTVEIVSLGDVMLDETITIPENANIIITDDGNPHTFKRSAGNAGALFTVGAGAKLTFTSTASDEKEMKLIIDGNKNVVTYTSGATSIVDLGAGNCELTINRGVQFRGNRSYANGGVITTAADKPAVISILGGRFADNETVTEKGAISGGVMYIANGSTAVIRDAEFNGNILSGEYTLNGGVLYVDKTGKVEIDHCTFKGNRINYVGKGTGNIAFGGVMTISTTAKDNAVVKNSTFTENGITAISGNGFGGAFSVGGSCHLTMSNCEFSENYLDTAGTIYGGKDVRTAGNTVIHLSGKINGEFFNTGAAYTLDITDALTEGSAVTMKWNSVNSVEGKTVVTFAKGIMDNSKNYISLDESLRGSYFLDFSDDKAILLKKKSLVSLLDWRRFL